MDTFEVNFNGPALSILLYENIGHGNEQEGFLLGDVVEEETKKVTDADERAVSTKRITRFNSVFPCSQPFLFHDNGSVVNEDKVKSLLGKEYKHLVGWFRFKRTQSPTLTLREKSLHKQLANLSGRGNAFILCRLSWNATHDLSTHTFAQRFFHYHHAKFSQLRLHISNLSDSTSTYRSAQQNSNSLERLLRTIPSGDGTPLNRVISIHTGIQKHMKELVEELADSEKELFQLEKEVRELEDRKREQTELLRNSTLVEKN